MTSTTDKPESQSPKASGPGAAVGADAQSAESLQKLAAKRQIGYLLLEAGQITKEQFDKARDLHEQTGGEILDILFSLDYIEPNTFLEFLLSCSGMEPADLELFEIGGDLIALLPAEFARKHELVPIDKVGDVLTLGTVSPLDTEAVQEIEAATGLSVKPILCKPEDVRTAIARYYPAAEPEPGVAEPGPGQAWTRLREPLRLTHVAHLVGQVKTLPVLPETVAQVREATENPESSVADIVDIITLDPPIAAKVLSVANSAAYGFAQRISDLKLAVSLLGLRETYSIVLSAAVIDLVNKFKHFDYRSFFLDAVCCATASRIVARASGRPRLTGIFSAGLLHDIGRAALWEVAPGSCAKLDPALKGRALVAEEEQIIGVSHPEAGYELASHWNLPIEIAEPIRFHHQPERAAQAKEHTTIVSIADVMVEASGTKFEENPDLFADHKDTLDYLGIDSEAAEAMLEKFLSRFDAAVQEAFD